jgi:hypothetical protein
VPLTVFEGKHVEADFEDVLAHLLSNVPKYTGSTFDQWGAPHFISTTGDLRVWEAYHYDATGEPWDTPTTGGFTGFARDGTSYTAGVQDGGPIFAPWAAEAQGTHRSPRADFPIRSLIVIAQGTKGELVIFDLDGFDGTVASLVVWMRFEMDASNFRFLGRSNLSLQHASMRNGVLTVATQTDSEAGAVYIFDFKRDGNQSAGQFITPATHQRLAAAIDLTNRNDNGGGLWTATLDPGSITVVLESVDAFRVLSWYESYTKTWVIVTGDNQDPQMILFNGGVATQSVVAIGDDRGDAGQSYFHRSVWIDRDGWLWFSRDNKLWRNTLNWRDGRIFQFLPTGSTDFRRARQQRGVELPIAIRWLASAREYIFAATDAGVYAIHRGTMDFYLAYSFAGGGGKGRLPTTATGEKMAGNNRQAYKMWGFDIDLSGYLTITSLWDGEDEQGGDGGGVTIMRLYDDDTIQQLEHPAINDDGAFFNIPFTTV